MCACDQNSEFTFWITFLVSAQTSGHKTNKYEINTAVCYPLATFIQFPFLHPSTSANHKYNLFFFELVCLFVCFL